MSTGTIGSRLGRRAFLTGIAGTAGCTGVFGKDTANVSVLAAGSIQAILRDVAVASDARVEWEAMGSVAASKLVASGDRDPDVLALSDTSLLADASWYARFATNELVVAYNPETRRGRRVADADRWFEPVLSGRARLGRTDPALDPLGYRTRFMVTLGAEYYDRPGLPGALLSVDQVYPETALLSQFESGSIDAAVVYRNMAVERDYPRIELPAAVNLSSPAHCDAYGAASYGLPSGRTVRGDVIRFGATARRTATEVTDVFHELVSSDVLETHGFVKPNAYPEYVGNVPDDVR